MYIEFDLPDLSESAGGVPQYWMKTLFVQAASSRYQINALTSTYVRLVEAALIEYQLGALKLREFWGTHTSLNLGAMHRSMSHFETCLSNLYRATNCFRRLRRDRGQDPISRKLSRERANFATDPVADRFRLVRNEIHHLEEMIMDRRISEGQPFGLKPDGPEVAHPTEPNQTIKTIDRLVIGEREVRLSEISNWLTEMLSFANKIADYLPISRQGSGADAS